MSIELLNIDCMEYMSGLPDQAFDLAIVDPPYGLGNRLMGKSSYNNYEFKAWDNAIPTGEYFSQLFRISRNQIIWGANYFTKHLPGSMGWIFWDKGQRIAQSDGELAFTSFDRAFRVFTLNRVAIKTDGSIHPSQKPVKLYNWLLDNYAKENDNIIDTHLGSGSSAISAFKRGFNFVGCEIDKDYFKSASKRFREQTIQIPIFNPGKQS